jgi:hypothetical protein
MGSADDAMTNSEQFRAAQRIFRSSRKLELSDANSTSPDPTQHVLAHPAFARRVQSTQTEDADETVPNRAKELLARYRFAGIWQKTEMADADDAMTNSEQFRAAQRIVSLVMETELGEESNIFSLIADSREESRASKRRTPMKRLPTAQKRFSLTIDSLESGGRLRGQTPTTQ